MTTLSPAAIKRQIADLLVTRDRIDPLLAPLLRPVLDDQLTHLHGMRDRLRTADAAVHTPDGAR